MSWTDERVELLKKLWADGLSASQIAGELGGITRNAVIGKVHRLGLSGRAKSPSSSAPRARKPRTHMMRVQRPMSRGNTALALAYEMDQEPEPELIENIIPIGQRRTLLELKRRHLPLADRRSGDHRILLSGGKPLASLPYCNYHSQASPISRPTNAATASRRRSGRVSRIEQFCQSAWRNPHFFFGAMTNEHAYPSSARGGWTRAIVSGRVGSVLRFCEECPTPACAFATAPRATLPEWEDRELAAPPCTRHSSGFFRSIAAILPILANAPLPLFFVFRARVARIPVFRFPLTRGWSAGRRLGCCATLAPLVAGPCDPSRASTAISPSPGIAASGCARPMT